MNSAHDERAHRPHVTPSVATAPDTPDDCSSDLARHAPQARNRITANFTMQLHDGPNRGRTNCSDNWPHPCEPRTSANVLRDANNGAADEYEPAEPTSHRPSSRQHDPGTRGRPRFRTLAAAAGRMIPPCLSSAATTRLTLRGLHSPPAATRTLACGPPSPGRTFARTQLGSAMGR